MTRWPIEFPWQVIAALVIAILCFVGAILCAALAVGRTFRDWGRGLERGDVPPVHDWSATPSDFNREWYRSGR